MALKYPLMQEPNAAGGRDSAIILTDTASSGAAETRSAMIRASPNEANAKAAESIMANPSESFIIFRRFLFPAPNSSETKRLVEIKIFPFASTMINPNSEVIRVITPTEAVPSLFDIKIFSHRPSPCKIIDTAVSRAVSLAIRFIEIFNVYPSFLSNNYENT